MPESRRSADSRRFDAFFSRHMGNMEEESAEDSRKRPAQAALSDYENHPDGRVEIHPCTIVYTYDGPAKDEAERLRQAIVLEVPNGAMLQFDKPFVSGRSARLGHLRERETPGNEVRIRSDGKSPAPKTTC